MPEHPRETLEARWSELESAVTACRLCPRLVAWREEVAHVRRRAYREEEYWGRPVPAFGDMGARVLVVGLAPAAHGANRTGRMFTGDSSGDFLYGALHRAGFANQGTSRHRGDGLTLHDTLISAVCRCAPPGNRPFPSEIARCLPYLAREIELLPRLRVLVALGRIAFDGVLGLYRAQGVELPALPFAHGAVYDLARYSRLATGETHVPKGRSLWLVASYHPSRQNTQTRRLTPDMFEQVWQRVRELLDETSP